MASTAPRSPLQSTALLTATALLAGAWFVSSLCYWQGRTFRLGGVGRYELMNWRSSLAPMYWAVLGIGIAWIVLWFFHARRTRRLGLSLAHAVVPALAFAFSAVVLSRSAMACGAF